MHFPSQDLPNCCKYISLARKAQIAIDLDRLLSSYFEKHGFLVYKHMKNLPRAILRGGAVTMRFSWLEGI